MIEYAKQKIGDLACIHAALRGASEPADAVVILCHGFGASGSDLVPVAGEMLNSGNSLANVRFIFPAAPIELDPGYEARAWWMIDMDKIQQLMLQGELREMRNEVPEALATRRAAIDQIVQFAKDEFGVSASQIIVGGFSQGAMLMTDVALNYQEPLGGLIVWSGSLINEMQWKEAAEKQLPLDVVQSHGRIDPILPFAGAEFLHEMLVATNHHVKFIEFNGQHTIPVDAIIAARELIEQVASDLDHSNG